MRYARYIVAAPLLLALLSACGMDPNASQTYVLWKTNERAAQDIVDGMVPVCRDGKEYIVYMRGPYTAVTATGELCVR